MVRIQLETGYLDVKDGTVFPLNFAVGDIRDLTKRTGTFSKTITLVGSKNNNNLLNHYYDVNIQAGTFDINALTKCSVIQEGVPILEDALLQLVSVRKTQQTDANEQGVEYDVLVKDTRVEFFTAIANKELTNLDFSDFNHFSNSSAIVGSFSFTAANGYKYVLPYNNTNSYNTRQIKPAIFAKTYFDRIFSNAGYSYTWSTLQDQRFDKLLVPYNGDENNIDWNDFKVKAANTYTTNYPQTVVGSFLNFYETLNGWSELLDPQNIFNPVTGVYTAPTDADPVASQSYEFKFNIIYEINFFNHSASPVQPYIFNTQAGTYVAAPRLFTPYLRAVGPAGQGALSTLTQIPINDFIGSGTTTYGTYQNVGVTTPSPYIFTSDLLTLRAGIQSNMTFGQYTWRTAAGVAAQVDINIDIIKIEIEVKPSSTTQPTGGFIDVNEYVPKKIKQSDFMKSIFQMYNLYADVDPNSPQNIILKTRDDYYDSGVEKDWSMKLAKDREQNLEFLPDVTSKRLILTYKQDSDDPNKLYQQATNEIYGQQEYIFQSEYVKDVDTKELIFSPTPIAQTGFAAVLPMINGQTPKTNIRLLYDGGEQSCGSYNIIDGGSTGTFGVTTYPALTHFDNAMTPTFDINFGTCDFYYYSPLTLTANNLYNLYWRRTVNQINEGKMLTAYFNLNEQDIESLKLNDKIYIDNSWWNINKIMDYDANSKSLTKVELISVDSEFALSPFITNTVTSVANTTTAVALSSVLRSSMSSSNVILEGSDVTVYGRANTISQGVRGVVIGDGQTLDADGIITPRINGAAVTSKIYVALLTQSGSNDPESVDLSDNIGGMTWTRLNAGEYLGTPSTPLDALNTFVTIGNVDRRAYATAYVNSDGNISVSTLANGFEMSKEIGYELSDDYLNNTPIEVRIYG